MITEILQNILSHLMGTWHNYIWCWQLTLNKFVNAYTIKRKGTEALVTILYRFIDQLLWHSKNFSNVPWHTSKISTALNLLISHHSMWILYVFKMTTPDLGVDFNTAWHLLQPNNLRSFWHWIVSVHTLVDFLQYWSVIDVQTNTLT